MASAGCAKVPASSRAVMSSTSNVPLYLICANSLTAGEPNTVPTWIKCRAGSGEDNQMAAGILCAKRVTVRISTESWMEHRETHVGEALTARYMRRTLADGRTSPLVNEVCVRLLYGPRHWSRKKLDTSGFGLRSGTRCPGATPRHTIQVDCGPTPPT